MKYVLQSQHNALQLLENDEDWLELLSIIENISDDDILAQFNGDKNKSLSVAINAIFKQRLIALGWQSECRLFSSEDYENHNTLEDDYDNHNWTIDSFLHGSMFRMSLFGFCIIPMGILLLQQ